MKKNKHYYNLNKTTGGIATGKSEKHEDRRKAKE